MKITIVLGSDWEGVYHGDWLIDQGHSVQLRDVLEALRYEVEVRSADEKWLESVGGLPNELDDVVFENEAK